MDKYTNTQYGLLKEPLMENPKNKVYYEDEFKFWQKESIAYEAYLKTAIPKVEGFDDKIPLGSGGLIDGEHFEIVYETEGGKYTVVPLLPEHYKNAASFPLVDISIHK